MIVYGPVPSRRLGSSLGVNNIPFKFCSYSCVYCQIGRTDKMTVSRREFYRPGDIYQEAETKVIQLKKEGRQADYISFVPDGEPTLDLNLGSEIRLLKNLGIKTAVITNASLLWKEEVRADLYDADWVSVKLDAADEDTWRRIDRPHGALELQKILEGIAAFAREFTGELVTETMFAQGYNDSPACIDALSKYIKKIRPKKAYLLVPTRPPAESDVSRAKRETLLAAVKAVRGTAGIKVECITGDEREEGFFFTEDIENDLLSITSVHPVREEIVEQLLRKRKAGREIIQKPVRQGQLKEYTYEGKKFYINNTLRTENRQTDIEE